MMITNRCLLILIAVATVLAVPFSSPAVEPFGSYDEMTPSDFFEDYIQGHLELGLRYVSYTFDRQTEANNAEDSFYDDANGHWIEGYFIGSVDKLNEDPEGGLGAQNLFISWFPLADMREWFEDEQQEDYSILLAVVEGLGLDLTWANVRGESWTTIETDSAGGYVDGDYSDGTVVAEAPLLTVVLKIENPSPVTPYFGFGTANFDDPEVTEGWWHWGFGGDTWVEANAAYQAWRASGSPGNPNGGYRRTFVADGAKANLWTVGLDIQVHENLSLDLYYRQMDLVFDNTYTTSVNSTPIQTRYSLWDLSNRAWGFGMRYSF